MLQSSIVWLGLEVGVHVGETPSETWEEILVFHKPVLYVFAPLNDVHAYIAWSWKTTLITWIFYEDDIQLQIQVPSPGTLLSYWFVYLNDMVLLGLYGMIT